jgi:2-polyprenyl-6-methoxyphenol hydroxylase-like FAD-dependent oxidoreductase
MGGLTLALALQQVGLRHVLVERAERLGEAGAGLLLSPNAVRVLDAVGVLESLRGESVNTETWELLDDQGRILQRLRPSGADGVPALSLTRSALQQALLRKLEVPIETGREVSGVEPRSGGARVTFSDGSRRTASLVVGADGLRSRVRGSVFEPRSPRPAGYVGWRALVDGVPEGWQGGRVTEAWGKGQRFGVAPVGKDRCYWYATAPIREAGERAPLQRRDRLADLFADWSSPVGELIASTPPEEILESEIFDRPMTLGWSRGPVTLLGDAAHPMTPNLGQGAAMAMEDAWVLARCLAADFSPSAFPRYERARRWRKARVLWQSRAMGWLIQLEGGPWPALRNTAMRLSPPLLADLSLRSIFNFHPDGSHLK